MPNHNGCNQDWVTARGYFEMGQNWLYLSFWSWQSNENFWEVSKHGMSDFVWHHAFSHKFKEVSTENPINMSQDNPIYGRRKWPQDRIFAVVFADILIFEMSQSEIFCRLYTF